MPSKFLLISSTDKTAWPSFLRKALAPLGKLELVSEELASERVMQVKYDLIIVDATAIADSSALVVRLRHQCPITHIIVATASLTWQRARDALFTGASDYIRKTVDKEEILAIVENILDRP